MAINLCQAEGATATELEKMCQSEPERDDRLRDEAGHQARPADNNNNNNKEVSPGAACRAGNKEADWIGRRPSAA